MNKRVLIASLLIAAIVLVSFPYLLRSLLIDSLKQFDIEVIELAELDLVFGSELGINVLELQARHPNSTISVERFELRLSTISLFPGSPVQITSIKLLDWRFRLNKSLEDPDTEEVSSPTEEVRQLLDQLLVDFEHPLYQIQLFRLERGDIDYEDEDQDISLKVHTGQLKRFGPTDSRIVLDATLNNEPLNFSAQLSREGSTTELTGEGLWQDYNLMVSGNLDQILPLENLTAELRLTSPTSSPIMELLGAPEIRDGKFDVAAQLTGFGDEIDAHLDAMVGELVFDGELQFDLVSTNFVTDFTLTGPSLEEAGAVADLGDYVQMPFSIRGNLERSGTELSLNAAKVQLGEGYFQLVGSLPSFPSTDNWRFELQAEDFDLSFFQPLAACPLPNLPLNWQGKLTSNPDGVESIDIQITGAEQQNIHVTGIVGSGVELSGSDLHIEAVNLTGRVLTSCLELRASELTLDANLTLRKPDDYWQVSRFELNTDIVELSGKQTEQRQLEVELRTDNVATLSNLVPDAPFEFRANPLLLKANLIQTESKLAVTAGQIALGSSSGAFTGAVSHEGSNIQLTMEGPDLKTIAADRPNPRFTGPLPFQIQSELSLDKTRNLAVAVDLNTGTNHFSAKTSIDLTTQENLAVSIAGDGPELESLLGAFVPHDLPREAYAFNVELIRTSETIELNQLDLKVGEQSLTGQITLDLWPNVERSLGELTLNASSSTDLLRLLGVDHQMQDVPIRFRGHIESDQQHIQVHLTEGQIGSADLIGDVKITPGPIPDISVSLSSKQIHLPTFFADDGGSKTDRSEKLIPNVDLPFRGLHDFNLRFDWQGEQVVLRNEQTASSRIAFDIQDGKFSSREISWQSEVNQGTVDLNINAAPNSDTAKIELDIDSQRVPLLWLFAGTPSETQSDDNRFRARLTSEGSSSQQIINNLNGAILFRGGGGRIQSASLDTIFGDFLHQISSNVLGNKNRQTRIACSTGAMRIEAGKVRLDPGIGIRTSRFDILTTGNITLPDEQLKLRLTSRSRKGIGVSAAKTLVPRVGIAGSITSPKLNLNPTDTALTSGAAIASSGLSILATGLWDRIRSSVENPCEALYSRAVSNGKEIYGDLAN